MLNTLFIGGQILALLLCLYGGWLTLRHADILGNATRNFKDRAGGYAVGRSGGGGGDAGQARILPR